ncbi:MAG: hypothetical protein JJU42_16550 [Rhodobacteraceae bacterium]|nr:hypothetical protein [Paracoccaceae bacterium]
MAHSNSRFRAMRIAKCSVCGHRNRIGRSRCSNCGAAISPARRVEVWGSLVLLIFGAIVAAHLL